MVMLFLEILLVCHIYGVRNYLWDLRSMLGKPKTLLAKWFGPTGYYPAFIWFVSTDHSVSVIYISFFFRTVVSPVICVIIFILSLLTQITYNMTYGKGLRVYVYPDWSIALGWLLSLIPFIFIPGFIVYNLRKFRQKNLVRIPLIQSNNKAKNDFRIGESSSVSNPNGPHIQGINSWVRAAQRIRIESVWPIPTKLPKNKPQSSQSFCL